MSFSEAVRDGFDHYAKFKGRASRRSFWWWVLFVIIVWAIARILFIEVIDAAILLLFVWLGLLLPGISKAIRRLHDTGRTGWWFLLWFTVIGAIVLLIFWLEDGDDGANDYGPPPADATPAPAV